MNCIFNLQSSDDIQIAAGLLGYTYYARVDHIAHIISNMEPGKLIVKVGPNSVLIKSVDARFDEKDAELKEHMAQIVLSQTDAEKEFIESINNYPFIPVVERRALLGWDERRYSETVLRLVGKGTIEKQGVRLGQGRPKVLYQLKGQVPSIKHEYYVHWIIEKLTEKGIACRAEKVGPDIQIPSLNLAINIELGTSDIHGNIPKALHDFAAVIMCSDDKAMLDKVSSNTKAENVLCALVQDVPALFD